LGHALKLKFSVLTQKSGNLEKIPTSLKSLRKNAAVFQDGMEEVVPGKKDVQET
jgi:hypothetical protein